MISWSLFSAFSSPTPLITPPNANPSEKFSPAKRRTGRKDGRGRTSVSNPPRSFLIRHPVVRQEGFRFNPGEIASALLRRHRLADLEKVAEHHGLALGAQPRAFDQFAF